MNLPKTSSAVFAAGLQDRSTSAALLFFRICHWSKLCQPYVRRFDFLYRNLQMPGFCYTFSLEAVIHPFSESTRTSVHPYRCTDVHSKTVNNKCKTGMFDVIPGIMDMQPQYYYRKD